MPAAPGDPRTELGARAPRELRSGRRGSTGPSTSCARCAMKWPTTSQRRCSTRACVRRPRATLKIRTRESPPASRSSNDVPPTMIAGCESRTSRPAGICTAARPRSGTSRRADEPRRRECAALPRRAASSAPRHGRAHVVELPMRGELDVMLLPRLARELKRLEARPRARALAPRRGSLRRLRRRARRRSRRAHAARRFVRAGACSRGSSIGRIESSSRCRARSSASSSTRGCRPSASAADPERRRHAALPSRFGARASDCAPRSVCPPTRSSSASSRSSSRASVTRGCLAPLPALVRERPRLRVLCFGRGPLERAVAEASSRSAASTSRVVLRGFSRRSPAAAAGPRPARAPGRARGSWDWRCSRPRAPACRSSRAPSAACPTWSSTARPGVLVPRDEAVALDRAHARIARGRGRARRARRRGAPACGAAVRLGSARRGAPFFICTRRSASAAAAVEPAVSP